MIKVELKYYYWTDDFQVAMYDGDTEISFASTLFNDINKDDDGQRVIRGRFEKMFGAENVSFEYID